MRTNKTKKVLEHLQTKGSISSMEAITLYGATRLSAIIFNLKESGYDIISDWETGTDRYGDKTRYVRYRLRGNNERD